MNLFVPAELSVLKERIRILTEYMKEQDVELCLITDPLYRRYLVDEESEGNTIALLIVDKSGMITQIKGQGRGDSYAHGLDIDVKTFVDYSILSWANTAQNAFQELSILLNQKRPRKIGFDFCGALLSEPFLKILTASELLNIRPFINRQRLAKAPFEIERIRRAGSVNQTAYESIRQRVTEGISEIDLFAIMTENAIAQSKYQVNFVGKSDLISGERTMAAGGPPTNRKIHFGETIIVDLFPTIHGYHADNCRTFVVGEPSPLQETIHHTVLSALKEAESLLYPGNRVKDIFNKVNDVLKQIGRGYSLFHHLGHGIGLQDQEPPYLIPGSDETIQEGMVVSIEPGIYLEGHGVRIENAYAIGKDGPVNLTPFSTALTTFR